MQTKTAQSEYIDTSEQACLRLRTVTSAPGSFWVNSAIIYGQKEAALIDAQFTLNDAARVVSAIKDTGTKLVSVYVTHWHPDHYFGLGVIKAAFPEARLLALPAVVNRIKNTWRAKVEEWKPVFGEEITAAPLFPERMQGNELMLEGEAIKIYGKAQGDAEDSSYVWIPCLKTAVCGDIVYNGVYPWTRDTDPAQRREWIKTIERIEKLSPDVVVAGHKNPDYNNDPSCLQFMKDYLDYYDEALVYTANPQDFIAKLEARFPNLGMKIILELAAEAAFSDRKTPGNI